MESIYLADDPEDAEPHSPSEIVEKLDKGELLEDVYAFVEGMVEWRSVREALLWAQAADVQLIASELLPIIRDTGIGATEARKRIHAYLDENRILPIHEIEELLTSVVDLNRTAASARQEYQDGQTAPVLKQFPAQELTVTGVIRFPRDWEEAWLAAGGQITSERYIARKDDPVWSNLSDFGVPYPPYSLERGIGVRDIGRDDAIAMGVIKQDDEISPVETPNNPPPILLADKGPDA